MSSAPPNPVLLERYADASEDSPATLKKYLTHLTEFSVWLDGALLEASKRNVVEFLDHLGSARRAGWLAARRADGSLPTPTQARRPQGALSASSRKAALCALRSFFSWAIDRDYTDRDPTARVKAPRVRVKRGLTIDREEVRRFLDAPGTPRDRVQAHLLVFTAARTGELRNLRWCDVDFAERTLHLRGKGGKERTVPMHDVIVRELRRWRETVEATDNPAVQTALDHPDTAYVLLTRSGRQLSETTMGKQAKWRAARAGVQAHPPGAAVGRENSSRLHCHALRRTWATLQLNDGEPLDAVADVLGHESVDTCRRTMHSPAIAVVARRSPRSALSPDLTNASQAAVNARFAPRGCARSYLRVMPRTVPHLPQQERFPSLDSTWSISTAGEAPSWLLNALPAMTPTPCPRWNGVCLASATTRRVFPVACGSWVCPVCQRRKFLAAGLLFEEGILSARARPERVRFITLTMRSASSKVPELSAAWNRLRLTLGRRRLLAQYACVVELQMRGAPHLHALATGDYIKQSDLVDYAVQAGFGKIVDIRLVRSRGVSDYAKKMAGYMSKTAGADPPRLRKNGVERLRPVRSSRGWFPGGLRRAERLLVERYRAEHGLRADSGPWIVVALRPNGDCTVLTNGATL